MQTEEAKVKFTLPIFWELWINTGIMNPLYKLIASEDEKQKDWENFGKTMEIFRIFLWSVSSALMVLILNHDGQSGRVFLGSTLVLFWIVVYSYYRMAYVNPLKKFESKVETFFKHFCYEVIDSSLLWSPIERIEKVLLEQALMPGEKTTTEARFKVILDQALSVGYMDGNPHRAYFRIYEELVPQAKKQWDP